MFGFSFFWQKRRNQIKYIRCIAIFVGEDIIKQLIHQMSDVTRENAARQIEKRQKRQA